MAWTERYVRADAAGGGDGTADNSTDAWTLAEAAAAAVTGTRFNIRKGNYTVSASTTFQASNTNAPNYLRGFKTSPGDLDADERPANMGFWDYADWPFIFVDGGSLNTGNYNFASHLRTDSNVNGRTVKVGNFGSWWRVVSRLVDQLTSSNNGRAIMLNQYASAIDCDAIVFSGGAVCGAIGCEGEQAFVEGCRIQNPVGVGVMQDSGFMVGGVSRCIIEALTGIRMSAIKRTNVYNCTFRCTGDAVLVAFTNSVMAMTNCVSYGGNRFYNGSAGVIHFLGRRNAVGGASNADVNLGDLPNDTIALSADPHVDADNGDFRLNDTAGGGALCRSVGLPGGQDLGALQSVSSGGGGSTFTGIIPSSGRRLGL